MKIEITEGMRDILQELSKKIVTGYINKTMTNDAKGGMNPKRNKGFALAMKKTRGLDSAVAGMPRAKVMAREETDLEEGLKKVGTYTNTKTGESTTVHRDSDWNEYRVRHHDKDGNHIKNADYHDDKEGAHAHAKMAINADKYEKAGGDWKHDLTLSSNNGKKAKLFVHADGSHKVSFYNQDGKTSKYDDYHFNDRDSAFKKAYDHVKEETDLDEQRGRPPKEGSAAWHRRNGTEAPPKMWAGRGRKPSGDFVNTKSGEHFKRDDADKPRADYKGKESILGHLAATMDNSKHETEFSDGSSHVIDQHVAHQVHSHLMAMRPKDRAPLQDMMQQSHAHLMAVHKLVAGYSKKD